MKNLISQIEQDSSGSMPEEVRLLKEHRKTLDDVIKFTVGINNLQKSLESVLLLKKPAKDIPRELLSIFGNISDSISNLPSAELDKRLKRVEATIQNDINTIMGLSQQLSDSKALESNITSEKLHNLTADFKRRSNTAIILKLHLRKRGAVVTESIIPVDPEVLVSQITKLVIEEKKYRQRTKDQFTKMDKELEKIIQNNEQPDLIKQYALTMRKKINDNIEHLDKGKDLEKMPFVIDIVEVGDDENKQQKKKPDIVTANVKNTKETSTKTKTKNKTGALNKITKWLSSPWSVKWKDVE